MLTLQGQMKKKALDDMSELFSLNKGNFSVVSVCWVSPLTKEIENRHAFTSCYIEAALIADYYKNTYTKYDYPFTVYINGDVEYENINVEEK